MPKKFNLFIINLCACAISYSVQLLFNHGTLYALSIFPFCDGNTTVLQNLTYQIRNAIERNRVFVQNGHTRKHFGLQPVHDKSHVDPTVDPDKISAAVILHPRNTALQRTPRGDYQVVFEADFDRPVGRTQHSHSWEHYFHIVITKNTDQTTTLKYDFIVVTALINSYWILPK